MGVGIEAGGGLERHRTAQDSAIDLGQGHVHGDIAGAEAAHAVTPAVGVAAGEHHLEHRAIDAVEGRSAGRRAGGRDRETGGVERHGRRRGGQGLGDHGGGDRVLEAHDIKRQRIEAARRQGLNEGVDGRRVGGLHKGAVEHYGRYRGTVPPVAAQGIEVGLGRAGPVESGA